MYTLIWPQIDKKKAWQPQKIPRNDGYVYIITMHVCNTTNSLKYKKKKKTMNSAYKGKTEKNWAYGRTGT